MHLANIKTDATDEDSIFDEKIEELQLEDIPMDFERLNAEITQNYAGVPRGAGEAAERQ